MKKYRDLVLKNTVVTVKPVDRKNANMPKGYDGEFMFTGCHRVYRLPRHQNGSYLKFLTNEELEAFEELLQYNKGDLSFYKRENNFWAKFSVELDKSGVTLDHNEPIEALKIRLLQIQSEVAKSWKERLNNPGEYWFALVDEDVEVQDKLNLAQLKAKAYRLLSKIDGSNQKMINTLKVLGKTPSPDAKVDWLYTELATIIEQVQPMKGMKTIHDFIEVREDENFDLKVFIKDAINIGEIEKRGTIYSLAGGDKIGGSLDEAVAYFRDKANSDILKIIETKIK